MSKNEWKKWVSVVGRMLLAYALVFAQGAWATQNQGTKDKSGSPQKAAQQTKEKQSSAATSAKAHIEQAQGEESESAAEEKPSGDGRHEGIKVHGHWTIEVKNPDGTLVTHREFENSLSPGANAGAQLLSQILYRQFTPSFWAVVLTAGGTCNGAVPGQVLNECLITENYPGSSTGGPASNNLTVSANGGLTFNGSISAPGPLQITQVATYLFACASNMSPQTCFNNPGPFLSTPFPLTSASVTQSVQSGQIISVTVVISFS